MNNSADIEVTDGDPQRSHCGLYIHIPFCETKCGYCDFYSVAVKDRETRPVVRAVIAELTARVQQSAETIDTIFIGGGTPTILPPSELGELLDAVNRAVPRDQCVEFTVEANPATVDAAKANLLVRHGVTRVSLGAQSFLPSELATLERLHSPQQIPPSVAVLRSAGIGQINLDLISGIPGQTMETWRHSLEQTLALKPDHIACYGLTYEPGTRLTAQLKAGRVTPCDDELEAAMYEETVKVLRSAGYMQYEISNFAIPGCECRHNLGYWRNEPYIGIGPSAAGCVNGRRYKNVADIHGYVRAIEQSGCAEQDVEEIDRWTLAHEILLMQLRLTEGVFIPAFVERIGADPLVLFETPFRDLTNWGLLEVGTKRFRLTDQGRLVANQVILQLAAVIPEKNRSLPVLAA